MLRKVLYIAPRYHTNQVFAIRALIRKNIEVKFISQYTQKSENYEDIKSNIVGYSILFNILIRSMFWLDDGKKAYIQRRFGFPPLFKMFKSIKKFNPDMIIIRDRTIYSLVSTIIARLLNKKFIIYTQTPKYIYRGNKLREKIKFKVFGKYEFTPVLGEKDPSQKYNNEENIFFVPLTIDENNLKVSKTNENKNSVKRILMVSEFIEIKNIYESLVVVNKVLKEGYKVHLTIIGSAKKNTTKKYLQKIKKFINDEKLKDNVKIKTDITHQEVLQEYLLNDVFLFASTRESAGYSLLEAMSSGLAVICSSGIGLHEYLVHNKGGYVFKDNDFEDLYNYLVKLLDYPDTMKSFGEYNLNLIRTEYNTDVYVEEIKKIWNRI